MFATIHFLRSYSSALPNRGADGLAKRCVYGGIERQRISSQCLKAALRSATLSRSANGGSVDDSLAAVAKRLGLGLAHRSREIFPRVVRPLLIARGLGETEASAWTSGLAALFMSGDKAPPPDGSMEQPIVLGQPECEALADIAVVLARNGTKPVRAEILKAAKAQAPALEPLRNPANAGIDGALFGRMSTADIVANVDAAVHVAHQLSTHPLQVAGDFFIVRDTLVTEHKGGSHMGYAELASGVLYGCVVVDLRQLHDNIVGLTQVQRGELVGWLVRALARVEPAAKRGSTAPYGTVHDMAVEVGDLQPRSAAAAFEIPTEPTGIAAVRMMREHLEQMDVRFGAPASRIWLSDLDEKARNSKQPSLELLSEEVAQQTAGVAFVGREAA